MKFTLTVAALIGSTLVACGSSDAASGGSSDPKDFAPLCQSSGVSCSADTSPLSMVGHYTGEGQTKETTNQLWSVGQKSMFDAYITQQSAGSVAGTFDLGSLHLDIKSGQIRGTEQAFTIYGTDVQTQNKCNFEFQALIVGAPAPAGSGATVAGDLVLAFTKNISGSGCTADELNGDPGTGAVFSYSANKAP